MSTTTTTTKKNGNVLANLENQVTVYEIPTTLGIAKEKQTSQLVKIKKDVCSNIEGNVRSLSSYFAEFRKNYKNVENWLIEANGKGRTFDTNKVHEIINVGKLSYIIEADKLINALREEKATKEGKKYTSPSAWSANRIFVAFVRSVETTPKATPKAK